MKVTSIAIIFSVLSVFSAQINALDCTQDSRAQRAKSSMSSSDDGMLCGNVAQFYAYLCECTHNPRTSQQAANLKATLETIKSSYNDYGVYCRGFGRINDTVPRCMVGDGDASNDGSMSSNSGGSGGIFSRNHRLDSDWGRPFDGESEFVSGGGGKNQVFNSEVMSLMNSLAADSKNANFRTMVDEMNSNSRTIDSVREITSYFGPLDQDSHDALNMVEDISQAIAIGKALFGTFSKREGKPKLSPTQIRAREKIQDMSIALRAIYDEVVSVPTFYVYNEETLKKLASIENEVDLYEKSTAESRLLYWQYVASDSPLNEQQLSEKYEAIKRLNESRGTEAVIQQIATIQASHAAENVPHIANADIGFRGLRDKVNLFKFRSYEVLGQPGKAEEHRKRISYTVPVDDAVRLMHDTYKARDYYSTIKYYEVISDYFLSKESIELVDLDVKNPEFNNQGIYRSDINFLLAMGVLANIKSGQTSSAQNAMDDLNKYQSRLENFYEEYLALASKKKVHAKTNEEYRLETEKGKAIAMTAQAYLMSKVGRKDEAIAYIDKAINLEKNAPSLGDALGQYKIWMQFVRTEILVMSGRLTEASEAMRAIKREAGLALQSHKAFDVADADFLHAYIRYKKQDYSGALLATRILARKYPKQPRIYALKEKVLISMGDKPKAEKAREEYEKMIKENAL